MCINYLPFVCIRNKGKNVKKSTKNTPDLQKESNTPELSAPKKANDIIDPLIQTFILENIRTLDYRDIAKFVKMKPDKLKGLLGELGIKVPVAGARKWEKIDVGKYCSISACSQCQVQMNHHTYLVGIKNCRRCIERNISSWIKDGEKIHIVFPE